MLRESLLGRGEQRRVNDGWHAEGVPVTLRTGASSRFRDALAFAPGGIPPIGGIRQYFADRLVAPDSLANTVGQATAFRVAICGGEICSLVRMTAIRLVGTPSTHN